MNVTIKEMLNKKKWAVIGVTPDVNKFAYKIFKKLGEKGYTVYGINPKYDEVDGQKIYKSIEHLPEKVECINAIVNPKIAINALDEIKKNDINYVWFQPGAFDDEVIEKAENMNMNLVYNHCLLIELNR